MKNVTLQATREKSGKTQAQVANEAGISVRVYQKYEYGECAPNIWTAIRIAKALGTTVEELFADSSTTSL